MTVNFLTNSANILTYTAKILRQMNLHEEYYVYAPNDNKPKYLQENYKSAKIEAMRSKDKLTITNGIQILNIVNRFNWNNIPF